MWEGKLTGNQLLGRKHDATEWYDVVLEIDEYNIWDHLLSGTSKVVTWLGGGGGGEEGMVPPPRAYSRSDIQYVTGGLLLCLRHDCVICPFVWPGGGEWWSLWQNQFPATRAPAPSGLSWLIFHNQTRSLDPRLSGILRIYCSTALQTNSSSSDPSPTVLLFRRL